MGIPEKTALEAAAPLVECAVKIDVSIPANLSCSLIQRPIVGTEAGPCGLLLLIKREAELLASHNAAVRSK